MVRIAFGLGFLILSIVLVLTAIFFGHDTPQGELLLGLGTEVLGILITVAFVDWLLERRRLLDRARELAWTTLHALERCIWVWQGGPGRMETDELLALLNGVDTSLALAPTTRALLAALGTRSREALNREPRAIRTIPDLKLALEELTSLDSLAVERSSVTIAMVREVGEAAGKALARALGQPLEPLPIALVRHRDPSFESQSERFKRIRVTGELNAG